MILMELVFPTKLSLDWTTASWGVKSLIPREQLCVYIYNIYGHLCLFLSRFPPGARWGRRSAPAYAPYIYIYICDLRMLCASAMRQHLHTSALPRLHRPKSAWCRLISFNPSAMSARLPAWYAWMFGFPDAGLQLYDTISLLMTIPCFGKSMNCGFPTCYI